MAKPGAVATIEGLDELRAVLRRVDRNLGRTLGQANKRAATVYADRAKVKIPNDRASGRGLEKGIVARAAQRDIRMAIRSTGSRPTIAAVLGANVHPVFGRRYPMRAMSGTRPWKPHLGSGWKPEQLYGIGPVFDDVPNEVAELWFDAVRDSLEGFLRD
jgi:hypothetical protein